MYKALAFVVRVLSRLPFLSRRFRLDKVAHELQRLDTGQRAADLQEWKRWAHEYLAWQRGEWPTRRDPVIH